MSVGAVHAIQPPLSRAGSRTRRAGLSTGWTCFAACLAVYLGAAAFASFVDPGLLGSDGVSRVAIANRILFSEDPHLGAIGFVWSPIPVLALLPMVALKGVFPAFVSSAFAGTILSAVFMAGSVAQMAGLLAEIGVRPWPRWLLTATFALHPLILLYAMNAMSESGLIFFLMLVTRSVNRWLRSGETGALVATGFYLALAYLTRYETAAAALAVAALVALASFASQPGPPRERLRGAAVHVLIAIVPFAVAFWGWALASWLLTGQLFDQFSSSYGNSQQISALGLGGQLGPAQLLANARLSAVWMLSLEPVLPLALVAGLVVIVRRRDWRALGAPVVLGAVVTFMTYATIDEKIAPAQIRYFIVVIPLVVVAVGTALGRGGGMTSAEGSRRAEGSRAREVPRRRRRGGPRLGWVATAAAVLAMTGSVASGLLTVASPADNGGTAYAVRAIVDARAITPSERAAEFQFGPDRAVSRYVDSLHLPPGSILVDDFIGFIVVMSSDDPAQYIIPSDREFQQALASPAVWGVRYVLIPQPVGLGKLDAVNRAYPGAYADGAGIGRLVKTFSGGYHWRLYRVPASG